MSSLFVIAVDKLIWTTELSCHNVNIRLMFTVTGSMRFFS